jgi:hypothetical protein
VSNIEVTGYTSSAHALTTSDGMKLTATQESITLRCVVRVENAGYSYEQMSARLSAAVGDGTFDTLLYNYAVYLRLSDATDASARDVSTEQVSSTSDSSGNRSSTSSVVMKEITIAMIVICVAFALAAIWYFRDFISLKRLSKCEPSALIETASCALFHVELS